MITPPFASLLSPPQSRITSREPWQTDGVRERSMGIGGERHVGTLDEAGTTSLTPFQLKLSLLQKRLRTLAHEDRALQKQLRAQERVEAKDSAQTAEMSDAVKERLMQVERFVGEWRPGAITITLLGARKLTVGQTFVCIMLLAQS